MRNKILISLLAGVMCFCVFHSSTEATQLDTYRNMLAKRSFTLRYSIAPEMMFAYTREHNRAGMGEISSIDMNKAYSQRPNHGIIVADGTTLYTGYL